MTGDATVAAIPVFLATMTLENLLLRRRPGARPGEVVQGSNAQRPLGFEPKDTLASLAMGTGMLVIGLATERALAPVHEKLYEKRVADLGRGRAGFAAAMLAWDLLYYWDHRWSHVHRVLWASHVNHHSSERYNLSTALRQSWTTAVVDWVFSPMYLLGFTPTQVARAGQLNLLYQYWVHTELVDRLPGWFELVMNTPSHHRVHHGSNPQYLDRNFGGILILWDRLFRTFEPEDERVRYGLTTNIDTYDPVRIAFHEWAALARDVARAPRWRDRLAYLVRPPGWAPTTPDPV